ncbi:MAG TPA: transposase, partial [Candidatus Binataceae bacterium]
SDPYDQRLSDRRAESERNWFVTKEGLKAVNLATKGYGAQNPVAPNTRPNGSDDPDGRQKNRKGLEMLQKVRAPGLITVAGEKGYNAEFVASCRALNVTPHVAQNERRQGGSALDLRTTSWPGYAVSQRVRKRVEEIFGWIKTVGNFRRTRYRGVERTSFAAYLVGAAYNLLRIAKLCPSG